MRTGHAAALLLAAWAAAAPGARADTPAAQAAPAEAERRWVFDVGWDDGPTYELSRRLEEWRKYDRGLLSDVQLRGRFGGSVFLDGGWIDVAQDDRGFEAKLRRARLYTRGELVRAGWPTDYRIQFAYESGSFYLNDFYLRWRPPRWVDTIRVGYFDSPISLESLVGSADRTLMEVPAAVAAFAPGQRLGVEVTRTHEHPSLTWALNLASVGQSQPFTEASSDTLRGIGRLVWRPRDDAAPDGTLLHLGASASFVLAGGGELQYRSRPESILAPFLADTGSIDGDSIFFGLEAAWRRGPFSAQAEMLRSFVRSAEAGDPTFHGLYAQASWAVTGESRPYDRGQAIFGRLQPAAPFAPGAGRWGALELTARTSWLDLDDGVVRGGRLWTLSAGPAWTWNRWVRILGGYVFAHTSGGAESSDAHVLQLRLELQL